MPIMEGVTSDNKPKAPLIDGTTRHLVQDAYAYGVDTGGTAHQFATDTSGRPYPAPSTWTTWGTTEPNAAGTITKTGEANKQHCITAWSVTTFGSVTANDVTVKLLDGTVGTAWYDVIGSGASNGERVGMVIAGAPIVLTAGEAAKLSVTAAGTVCQLVSNMAGYTR